MVIPVWHCVQTDRALGLLIVVDSQTTHVLLTKYCGMTPCARPLDNAGPPNRTLTCSWGISAYQEPTSTPHREKHLFQMADVLIIAFEKVGMACRFWVWQKIPRVCVQSQSFWWRNYNQLKSFEFKRKKFRKDKFDNLDCCEKGWKNYGPIETFKS